MTHDADQEKVAETGMRAVLVPSGPVLALVNDRDGNVIRVPSALEIFTAIFDENPAAFSIPLAQPPLISCADIRFDRVPADITVIFAFVDGTFTVHLEAIRADSSTAHLSTGPLGPDHVLSEGRWTPLVPGVLEEVGEFARQCDISIPGPVSLAAYGRFIQAASPNVRVELRATADELRAHQVFDVPAGFVGNLYPYQLQGCAWLKFCMDTGVGCILADQMGLGKTAQIIAVITAGIESGEGPYLVVAPATILENWRRELARFAPNVRAVIHSGGDRTGDPRALKQHDVILVSWGTLPRDLSLFRMVNWAGVFLDEAQAIKNPEAQRTWSAMQIPSRTRVPVTGTPVENRLLDLCTLLAVAAPAAFADPAAMAAQWSQSPDRFGQLCAPFILRRTVSAVANDLPPLVRIPEAMMMTATEANLYRAIRSDCASQYGRMAPLVSLGKLRQACAHPFLISPSDRDPADASEKYERLCEILSEMLESGEKAIIASPWHELSNLMVRDLARRFERPVLVVDGRTPQDQRQLVIDEFSCQAGFAALVLGPRAAGTGLNITAARHVIHYVPEWNPATQDQLTARAYRRGQEHTVFEHRLYYTGTVEEAIESVLAQKRSLAQDSVIESIDKSSDTARILTLAFSMNPEAMQ